MTAFASDDTISVYPFRLYDIASDDFVTSKRLATMPAIQKLGAVLAGPSYIVPQSDVNGDGFTEKDYNGPEAERALQQKRGY